MTDSSHLIGRLISHYRIVGKLGAEGMGEVYRAHERLKRDIALKILKPGSKTSSAAQQDLLREAQSASVLDPRTYL
jgi:serine/threonine protein kinase